LLGGTVNRDYRHILSNLNQMYFPSLQQALRFGRKRSDCEK
jgi:hypothetical protein